MKVPKILWSNFIMCSELNFCMVFSLDLSRGGTNTFIYIQFIHGNTLCVYLGHKLHPTVYYKAFFNSFINGENKLLNISGQRKCHLLLLLLCLKCISSHYVQDHVFFHLFAGGGSTPKKHHTIICSNVSRKVTPGPRQV